MASPRKDRILTADAKEILDAAKPSILGAAPRRGGYVQKAVASTAGNDTTSPITSQNEESVQMEGTSDKSCFCSSVTNQGSSFVQSVGYAGVDQHVSCQSGPPVESLYKKSNFSTTVDSTMDTSSAENASMLAIVISTVMLMASEYPRIPDEFLEYTKNYLECIKDGSEEGPPNIQGILKHIKYLRDNGLVRPMGEQSQQNVSAAGAEGVADSSETKTQKNPSYKKHQDRFRRQLPRLNKPKSTAL